MLTNKVTLVILDTYDPNGAAAVLTHCASLMEWADVKLLTHCRPAGGHAGKYIQVPQLTWQASTTFYLRCLNFYIDSEYTLSIHRDGFIINPHLWQDSFLDYDYIGAPWPASFGYRGRVGNGGFSLRSKRLLEMTATCPIDDGDYREDVFIADTQRDNFEAQGIKYPSVEVAASFALENAIEEVPFDDSTCFGFHGWVSGRTSEQYIARYLK